MIGCSSSGATQIAAAINTTFIDDHTQVLFEGAQRWLAGRLQTAGSETDSAKPAPDHEQALPDGVAAVRAPLIGTVLEVCVRDRDEVAAGSTLCVLESMKMEATVTAPFAGVVTTVEIAANGQIRAYEKDGSFLWQRLMSGSSGFWGPLGGGGREIHVDRHAGSGRKHGAKQH